MVRQLSKHPSAALALLRLHLLPSALADIFAGAALAGGLAISGAGIGQSVSLQRLFMTLLGSACLYCGGMVMNDVADAQRDLDLAASRPIPTGRISRTNAALLAVSLLLAAVVLLPMSRYGILPIAMVLGVVLYDFVGNRIPVFGAPLLGGLRAANLLLGFLLVAGPNAASSHPSMEQALYACCLAYAIYIAATVLHGSLEDTRLVAIWKTRLYATVPALCPALPAFWLPRPELALLAALPTAWLVAGEFRKSSGAAPVIAARTGILLRGISRFTLCLCVGTGLVLESAVVAVLAYLVPALLGKRRWT